ncbi:putative Mitotic-spindle organizing protein, partial [Naja naja]
PPIVSAKASKIPAPLSFSSVLRPSRIRVPKAVVYSPAAACSPLSQGPPGSFQFSCCLFSPFAANSGWLDTFVNGLAPECIPAPFSLQTVRMAHISKQRTRATDGVGSCTQPIPIPWLVLEAPPPHPLLPQCRIAVPPTETQFLRRARTISTAAGNQPVSDHSNREGSSQRVPRQSSASRLPKTGC